jgi:adenine C2-methylase RlmN of 23S rRNA A2503 and tRNA A37
MELITTTQSSDGTSVRYDFKNSKGFIEIMKIFNESPAKRTILCVPSSYGCALGCTFCHLTKAGSTSNQPVTFEEITEAISLIDIDPSIPVLISMMGAGEPLLNLELVKSLSDHYPISLATSLPTEKSVDQLVDYINLNPSKSIKIYVSVHSFIDSVRKTLMPNSVDNYKELVERLLGLPPLQDQLGHSTNSQDRVVIHYTIIPGVNDSKADLGEMTWMLYHWYDNFEYPPKIKFLKWSDGDNTYISKLWMRELQDTGFASHFHTPRGCDIGGACGQFNPEYYN